MRTATSALSLKMNSPQFAALPAEERAAVVVWEDVMREIDAASNKLAVCREWACRNGHRRGWSADRIRARYYGWVASGRAWTALVDWARAPRAPGDESKRFSEAFKRYAEENQRVSKAGWSTMIRDLRRGKVIEGIGTWRDVWTSQHPGEMVPEECPRDWIPRGWLYSNVQRKFKSTKFELTTMRKGSAAALRFAPAVYSTRVGLEPGRIYQFDDVWHDIKIALPGVNHKLMRPLEFACIDVASTNKVGWGIKPQIEREDGSREGLGKAQFKALIAHILCNVGYHPDGCVFVIEHGTASLNDVERATVERLTDGVVGFRDSKILGRQIMPGMFGGQGKGNFRAKALIESSHRLIHYAGAALPAQTGGLSRVDEPEQMYGLDKYAAKVLAAWERVPAEQRDLLWYGGALTMPAYFRVASELYDAIYSRTDHDIEGWEQNDWMVLEWSVDGCGGWRSAADIPKLQPAMQQVGRIAMQTPGLFRLRRMSPAEVWQAHQAKLVRVPHWAVCDFLGDDCYRTVRVGNDGLFAFQDRDLTCSQQKLRYAALVAQPDGSGARLAPGAEYGLYVLPHDLTKAVVVERSTRAVLGVAPAWSAVDPLNPDQVGAMAEAQARMIAAASAPMRERHAARSDEAVVRREQNDLLLEGLQKPRKPACSPPQGEDTQTTGRALKALATVGGAAANEGRSDEW
jgi:hypothetical protein